MNICTLKQIIELSNISDSGIVLQISKLTNPYRSNSDCHNIKK